MRSFGTISMEFPRAVLWIFALMAGLTPSAPAADWTMLAPGGMGPGQVAMHTAVRNSNTQSMIVMIEGETGARVLVLSNATNLNGPHVWTEIFPQGDPPASRGLQSVVYDSVNNRMMVFCGSDRSGSRLEDVWVLEDADGSGGAPTWSQLMPVSAQPGGLVPVSRRSHVAVYDATTNRMIVFGGEHDNTPLNDTWILQDANGLGGPPTWIELAPAGTAPSPRATPAAVYDPSANRLIVFGGGVPNQPGAMEDAHVLTHANGTGGDPEWVKITPAVSSDLSSPPGLNAPTAVYDPSLNRMIVFGGSDNAQSSFNDIWILSGANGIGNARWTQIFPSPGNAPEPRCYHTAIFDPITNRMTVFAGSQPGRLFDDVWILSLEDDIPFRRGEVNEDGVIDISDAVTILAYLFYGGGAPRCMDAADVDDSGDHTLTDAVYLLNFLFLGGPIPNQPFPACGLDLTYRDGLRCLSSASCP
jgi:hypothetical protein